jgi:hypothetical protein
MKTTARIIRHATKAASLLLALLMVFGGQSRPSAQTLSDVEISAGYCFGALDTLIKASQIYEKSLTDIEESLKIFREYQEIERRRPLTQSERALYDAAKGLYDVRQQILSWNKEYLADRERVRSYLMLKGFFSPSRALDFPSLLASINRGKVDFQLCDNEQQTEPTPSCMLKCATSYMNNSVARNACAEGCSPASCKRTFRCRNMTWLPF